MGIKTEDFASIPPKTMTVGIDWLGIFDSFDPTVLDEKYINECARRNPFETCYKWETPSEPIEERLRSSQVYTQFERRDLEAAANRINTEGLTEITYRNARMALIKAIGQKGAAEYNRREYERLGLEGRKKQAEEYIAWKKANDDKDRRREKIYNLAQDDPDFLDNLDDYDLDEAEMDELDEMLAEERESYYAEPDRPSVHEKVARVRREFKGSNGKPLVQRDFAKLIGYPINKYIEAEKVDRWNRKPESPVEFELLEKLVMICHANPYWLFDPDCEEYLAQEDYFSESVQCGDEPSLFAKPDVILNWIKEGRPRYTMWRDSRP